MTITVNTPDGGSANFPDGTTPDVIQHAMAQKFGAPAPEVAANAAGEQEGARPGAWAAIQAAAGQAANQGTFGLANYGGAAERWVAQHALMGSNADSYSTDLAYERGLSSGQIEGHPIAGTAGGVFGGTVGAGKLLAGVKGIGLVGKGIQALSATKRMGLIGNTIKNVAVNTAIGTGASVAEGEDVPDAAKNGLISGVLGTGAQHTAGFAFSRLAPQAQRAFALLAAKMGEPIDALEKAYDSYHTLTGALPSMAQITGLKTQGQLRALAAANPEIGEAAAKAANSSSLPFHEQVRMAQSASRRQTESDMLASRDAMMDNAMQRTDPRTGVSLGNTPVPIVGKVADVLTDPTVTYALSKNNRLLNPQSQFNTDSLVEKIANDNMTVGDIDAVRRALRNQQNVYSSREAGINRDPDIAKQFGDAAAKVEGIGISAHSGYGDALRDYRAASDYASSFAHALDGGSVNDLPPGNEQLSRALTRLAGQAGYEHGRNVLAGKLALDSISPSSIRPDSETIPSSQVAHAALAAVAPSPWSHIWHGIKAMGGGPSKLPTAMQQTIAKQLFSTDPNVVRSGFTRLRQAGAKDADMEKLKTLIGGAASVNAARYLGNQGESQ